MARDFLTPPQIAARLKVRPGKVLLWIASGELLAINVAENAAGKRPRWRVSEEALQTFLTSRSCRPVEIAAPRRQPRAKTVPHYV